MNSEPKLEVKSLLEEAARELLNKQQDIYSFTPQSGETEWNLAHPFANEVSKRLCWLSCDLEITKTPQYDSEGRKRPDIVFHKRGVHDENLLVIELKLKRQRQSVQSFGKQDAKKIETHWFNRDFGYAFGAQVNFKEGDRSKFKVRVFQNPEAVVD